MPFNALHIACGAKTGGNKKPPNWGQAKRLVGTA
eukprot:COSAG04_NODE_29786_length_266_cov_1.508982_1_plen_33_part_01